MVRNRRETTSLGTPAPRRCRAVAMPVLEISQLSLRYAETRIRSDSRRARLAATLAQQGQLSPVLVHPDGEQFVLVHGYLRVAALQDLGEDLVHALVLEMSPAEALLVAHHLERGRHRSAIEDAWILRVLIDEHDLRLRDLAAKLERSASWVSRRLALVEVLPESVQEAIRRGLLCPQAAMKSLVPLARANVSHCEQLVASLAGAAPTVRELDQLWRAWRGANPAVRERIVSDPQLFLRAVNASPEPHRSSPSPADQLIALGDHAHRIIALLDTSPDTSDPNRLRDAWTKVCHAFESLEVRLDDLHARRRDPTDHSSTPQDGPGQARHFEDPQDIAQLGSLSSG